MKGHAYVTEDPGTTQYLGSLFSLFAASSSSGTGGDKIRGTDSAPKNDYINSNSVWELLRTTYPTSVLALDASVLLFPLRFQ